MWEFIIITALIVGTMIYMQHKHYEYMERKFQRQFHFNQNTDIHEKLKDFEEYKKRVDALTLRAGFKL